MPDPNEPTYPEPIQGGGEKVTRQRGNYDDRMARQRGEAEAGLPPIVQPGGDLVVTRQRGLQYTDSSGVLVADHVAEAGIPTFVADRPVSATEDAGFPGRPGVVPGVPAATPPVVDGAASDQPAPGQRVEGAPEVFTAEQLAAAKKAGKK